MEGRRLSVDQKIRDAQARGEFDNLPGAGKPLNRVDLEDPEWWIKSLVRREKIDPDVVLHPTLILLRERDSFPESLGHLRSEAEVRAALEEFNERVHAEWRRPAVGPSLPVVARPVNIERMLVRWRDLRERLAAEAWAAAPPVLAEDASRRRWRLRRGRRG
jgi:hypothetical protein